MSKVQAGGRQAVILVDADEVYRAGVVECCRRRPELEVWAYDREIGLDDISLPSGAKPITALVEVSSPLLAATDAFEGVAAVVSVREQLSSDVRVVATCRRPASRYLALRLAEAGADFYYGPLHQFGSADELVRAVRDPSEGCRLPTQWALREELGLSWDGNLAAFLEAIEPYPDVLWHDGIRQSELPVSRRSLHKLRVLAHEVAGLPAPDFRRFTGGLRSVPTLPEWHEVRWLVRTLRGM